MHREPLDAWAKATADMIDLIARVLASLTAGPTAELLRHLPASSCAHPSFDRNATAGVVVSERPRDAKETGRQEFMVARSAVAYSQVSDV